MDVGGVHNETGDDGEDDYEEDHRSQHQISGNYSMTGLDGNMAGGGRSQNNQS